MPIDQHIPCNRHKRAKAGDPSAQHDLGYEYYSGGKNLDLARKWFIEAANNNNRDAQVLLGQIYEDGRGVRINYEKAFNWYRRRVTNLKSNEKQSGYSLYKLGFFRENGLGVERSNALALKWYRKAGKNGRYDEKAIERVRSLAVENSDRELSEMKLGTIIAGISRCDDVFNAVGIPNGSNQIYRSPVTFSKTVKLQGSDLKLPWVNEAEITCNFTGQHVDNIKATIAKEKASDVIEALKEKYTMTVSQEGQGFNVFIFKSYSDQTKAFVSFNENSKIAKLEITTNEYIQAKNIHMDANKAKLKSKL